MFTGIVAELGTVVRNAVDSEGRLAIAAVKIAGEARIGDSISVNGCCLTVVEADASGFVADVMPETAHRTNLGGLRPGDPVNLEAAMALSDRLGGHLVTGHVDGTGEVLSLREDGIARWAEVSLPGGIAPYIVAKGCVAVDGISLTVVDAAPGRFTVSLIPHTLASTRAGTWTAGAAVNLEADIVAKYVEGGLRAHIEGVKG